MRPTLVLSRPVAAVLVAFSVSVFAPTLCADDATERISLELFEKQVRPTLLDACINCHGPEKQKGGLRLDSAEWLRKGGDSGEVIDVDDPDESILLSAIRYNDPALEMPPKGKLPDETVSAFEAWVRSGASDPRTSSAATDASEMEVPSVEKGRSFWAFQPVQANVAPAVIDQAWPLTRIDRFILAKLEAKNITPTSEADRATLLRRVHYDLIGLPPTPKQIQDFVNDESTDAYEHLIDRLLNSPQFGERWGRHWLDVVRFAQSSGGGRTLMFPDAWRYRDYVIDAFNNDMPYDQFLTEQLAGDLLDSGDWRTRRRQLIATAFLLLGPTNYEKQDKDELDMDVVDEQLDTLGKAFMGMTIGCARCHDHKFDPIPTEDYYGLAGILKSTKVIIHDNVSTWNKVALPVADDVEALISRREQRITELELEIEQTQKQLDKISGKPKPEAKTNKLDKDIAASELEGIVVDDKAAELIGQWTPSAFAGRYVDEGYIHDGTADKGSKQVVYRPRIEKANAYEVRISYSPSDNRSTKVPVLVSHEDGESVVSVDQQKIPEIDGAFTSVGVYRFSEGAAKIMISNEGTEDGVVIADAVMLIPRELVPLPKPDQVDVPENIAFIVPDPKRLPGIVVDDVDAELVGVWDSSVHTPPFVGKSYRHDRKEAKGEKSAMFTPDLPQDGVYEVRIAHNANIRRATNVPITIRHADGTSQVHINESEPAPIDMLFRSIGEFRFAAGRSGSVTIETTGTDGKVVIIDAVQFIPISVNGQSIAEQKNDLQTKLNELNKELNLIKAEGPEREYAMATEDDKDAGDIPIAIRGLVHNPGPMTPRGLIQVASQNPRPNIPAGQSGRRELAQWIASADNPLTARVMVNRIWHWLFGRGIVATVDNFGQMGDRPTHPELLDYLAGSFVENGWSSKQLIREIMLSRVYRLGTGDSVSGLTNDPLNRLFWRMNRKRLDAEQLRDTLLVVADLLDETAGGSNVKPGTSSEYGYTFETTRRSVYVPVFRNTLPEIFEVFDFADPNIQLGKRTTSTVSSQALLLLNHPLVIEQTRQAAARMLKSGAASTSSRVEDVFLQLLGRRPSTEEEAIAIEFLGDVGDDADDKKRWAMLYQSLLQCVDFRFVD